MRVFGSCVMLPGTLALVLLAWRSSSETRRWIVLGALGGLVAAVAYDLYRLPFVLAGAPLFKVFPRFGEMLLGTSEPRWAVQAAGWSYHFLNGAALGVMFLAMVPSASRTVLMWGAVVWALVVEALLLITPYTSFLGLKLDGRFIFLTATAHAIFGIVLGLWCRARVVLIRQ